MANLHRLSQAQLDAIAIIEREADDIITLANTLSALLKQRNGEVVIGLTPSEYLRTLNSIITSIREEAED